MEDNWRISSHCGDSCCEAVNKIELCVWLCFCAKITDRDDAVKESYFKINNEPFMVNSKNIITYARIRTVADSVLSKITVVA